MIGLLRVLVLGVILASAGAALAQQTVPLLGAACPSGASFIGSGLCRSFSGAGYVPSRNGICPSGTLQAGGGYCQTDGRTEYLQRRQGNCPPGTTYAGAGYCRGR
jgi:hypothetical protein